MKKIIIVESPNKIKKLESFLDNQKYQIIASVGHIRDLKKYGTRLRLGIDLDTMTPIYENIKEKKNVINNLLSTTKTADKILLATDPDREGEAIAWHIQEIIKEKNKEKQKIQRIIFNEITKNAVEKAIKKPQQIDLDLVNSQETRRMLDRIIGFRLSYLTQKKLSAPSAGRVKSATLKLIIDREKEIKAFVSDSWWTIEATWQENKILKHCDQNDKEIKFKKYEDGVETYQKLTEEFTLLRKKEKLIKISAPQPLEMATFLIEVFNNFKISNMQATIAAQSLYEKGLISYPRTDSTRISSHEFIKAAKKFIENKYPNCYQKHKNKTNSKNTQDAHEAIRPTDINLSGDEIKSLNNYEKKIYDFIRDWTLKSLMKDGENKITNFIFKNNNEYFKLKLSKPTKLGFRIINNNKEENEDNDQVPKKLKIKKEEIKIQEHKTLPPARYNQATIVKRLKNEGIGRPSTYATTTTGLVNFGYLKKEKGILIPTKFAKNVNKLLLENFGDIIDEKYTAKMETILDEIAGGKENGKEYLSIFWKKFEPRIIDVDQTVQVKKPRLVGRKCPNCGNDLIYKNSRYGEFIGCINFPNCKYTESLKEKFQAIDIDKECPTCKKGKLQIKKSRYGTYFIGCSNYPKCKFIMNKKEAQPIIEQYLKKDK